MAKLTAAARRHIPPGDFALASRRYPIEDRSHARNALSRVSQYGTPSEKARVRAAVHAKYPGIGHQSGLKAAHHSHPHAHRLGGFLHAKKGR